MELLNFIFRLGVVIAIFSFIWGFFQIGYSLIRFGSVVSKGEKFTLKIIKYFFLVDVTCIFSFDHNLNTNQLIITALILLTYFISKLQSQQNKEVIFKFVANGIKNETLEFDLKSEITIIFIAMLFFIGFIFFPEYTQNNISIWFHESILKIEDTPIFGYIFKFIGFIFIVNMFLKMTNGINQIFTGKPFIKKDSYTKDDNPNKFDDFEELD